MDCMRDDFDRGMLLDGRFQTVAPLNHGSFGMVFVAKDLRHGNHVAIKCLTKTSAMSNDSACPAEMSIDDRSEELSIHSRIGRHPNIVNLISSFETAHHNYLVLDYCPNGDLYEAIRAKKGPLETEHVRDFMLQLVSAVEFIHSKGIYHRDIKPENIFLTQSGSMKLGDFGLATTERWSSEFGVGSDRYMSPEQYDGGFDDGYSPAAADIWAIGICLLNVLFSRNPFAFPHQQDPLFSDYFRDHQSLFDVFPNMSQDTFNVLMQCLSLDPSKRSLSGLREALQTVISFTTDDESLDEFCLGNDVVPATVNREPLRTPSINSPQVDNGSFPWAKALQATPQKTTRQLSVIHDEEEMFPTSTRDWRGEDAASLASVLDSGIGMSYKSSNMSSKPISMPVSSSLPISNSRAMASVYGYHGDNFSKSWNDLYEEEEEEMQRSSFDSADEMERVSTAKPTDAMNTRASTPALDIKPASRGASTPRPCLAEVKKTSSRCNSPESFRHRISSRVKQLASSAPLKNSPPKRPSVTAMDKWAVLGNLRRAEKAALPSTPKKLPPTFDKFSVTALGTNKRPKPRERAGSWRKDSPAALPEPYTHEAWNISTDWRSPQQPHYMAQPATGTPIKARTSPRSCAQSHILSTKKLDDEDDDLWVGGWTDFHL